jgi:hypothetical protein
MPPGMITRFVFGLEIQIFHFLCSVTLESIKTSIPLFFGRAPVFRSIFVFAI